MRRLAREAFRALRPQLRQPVALIVSARQPWPDAHLADFTEASLQQFLLASDVKIYPLFQARPGLVQAAPIALIHKSQIRVYHKG